MSLSLNPSKLFTERESRSLLLKWVVALLIPVLTFTIWAGESIVNNTLLPLFSGQGLTASLVLATLFVLIFYATALALVGYFLAADSGRRGLVELWIDIVIFTLVPLLLIILTTSLVIGLALCLVIWPIYFWIRKRVMTAIHVSPTSEVETIKVLTPERQAVLRERATLGGLWAGAVFGLIWLIIDIIYFASGDLTLSLLIVAIVRTILLPIAGYFLGRLGGNLAIRRALTTERNGNARAVLNDPSSKASQLKSLSTTRAVEEARDLVPNDMPLRSTGAQRFYLVLLVAFVLLYPMLDSFLFSYGTDGRLTGYGDAGYYIILALGLNIVVGFAGLLDLGYVAFFAIGAYTWGLVGSSQFTSLTGIAIDTQTWSWLFWPMLLVAACIAAFWGVVLGIPTLRLRGDYLAIVTLGFGEIIPIIFLNMDRYTNGTNGLVGVFPPKFPGVTWSNFTPIPYYYLILALIVLLIFINIRLRDSRLGRAWVAIREDEIAAASSGINLVNTKLFAFGAGAFFSGIAGAYNAAKLGNVTPNDFSSSNSIIFLAMVVIGGLGSIPGVIVGAIAVYAINQLILSQLDTLAADPGSFLHFIKDLAPSFTFSSIRSLIFGTILVVVMLFRPEGLIPSTRRKRELHHTDQETETGALDAVPGSAGFESEVRVE